MEYMRYTSLYLYSIKVAGINEPSNVDSQFSDFPNCVSCCSAPGALYKWQIVVSQVTNKVTSKSAAKF